MASIFSHHRADGERSTTAGVTVKFGEHNTVEVEAVVELFGGIHSVLTCHGVDNKQRFVGMHSLFQRSDLIHHLLIYGQASGCIYDDDIVAQSR